MNRELQEALISMREIVPRGWWAIYQGCLQTGFDRFQSFALLQAYILSQNPNGIQPPGGNGPSSNDPE